MKIAELHFKDGRVLTREMPAKPLPLNGVTGVPFFKLMEYVTPECYETREATSKPIEVVHTFEYKKNRIDPISNKVTPVFHEV